MVLGINAYVWETEMYQKFHFKFIFLFMRGAISWRFRFQECIDLSTKEVQYVAASEACKDVVWLFRLAYDMGTPQIIPRLLCDSQTVVVLAKNLVYDAKTKHIGV